MVDGGDTVVSMPDADAPDPEGEEGSLAATIRIVLAEDHAVVRRGLRMLLDDETDFEVSPRRATSRRRSATCAATIRPCSCST